MDIKSIQKAISNLPASSLTWDQFKCELNEIRKLNSDLDKMEKKYHPKQDPYRYTSRKIFYHKQ